MLDAPLPRSFLSCLRLISLLHGPRGPTDRRGFTDMRAPFFGLALLSFGLFPAYALAECDNTVEGRTLTAKSLADRVKQRALASPTPS